MYYGIDDVDFRRDSAKLMRASLCSRCSGRWALHLEELPWRINLRFSSFLRPAGSKRAELERAPRKSMSRAQLFARLNFVDFAHARDSSSELGSPLAYSQRWRRFWGKDAIETISRQLSAELPGLKGFSARNLRNMRTFYAPSSPRSRPRRSATSTSSSVTTAA